MRRYSAVAHCANSSAARQRERERRDMLALVCESNNDIGGFENICKYSSNVVTEIDVSREKANILFRFKCVSLFHE